jgi:hypothetical protein
MIFSLIVRLRRFTSREIGRGKCSLLHINGFNVPDDFTLLFPEEDSIQNGNYKVIWRNGPDLGAKFIGSAKLK